MGFILPMFMPLAKLKRVQSAAVRLLELVNIIVYLRHWNLPVKQRSEIEIQYIICINTGVLLRIDICLPRHIISLSLLRKLTWRHWIYKMPVRYILSSVWVRLSIFSPLSIIQYVGLYVFSSPISLVMIERIYILCLIIIIKSAV